ncbi:hypothetical protein SAMN05216299_10697 [Nitrosospira sp. Nsp14]|nr:hypothetical protein SAMN05216299_10697 [Nitrosospira sp. Nsp14]
MKAGDAKSSVYGAKAIGRQGCQVTLLSHRFNELIVSANYRGQDCRKSIASLCRKRSRRFRLHCEEELECALSSFYLDV